MKRSNSVKKPTISGHAKLNPVPSLTNTRKTSFYNKKTPKLLPLKNQKNDSQFIQSKY